MEDYDNISEVEYNNYISNKEETWATFDWNELVPTVIVYGFTFVLGLTGNCLIIFTTFRYRRMKSVTNLFLSSLACSDLLLIIICIPVRVAKLFSYTWIMGGFVCKSVYYMQSVSAICSVLTLTAISIERYYAIVHPMRAKYICTISQAKRIIIVIWVLAFVLAVPTILVQTHLAVGTHNQYYWCVRNWDDRQLWQFHEIYMLCLILIGPCSIMAFSYFFICKEIWNVMERRHEMTSKNALNRSRSVEKNGKLVETFQLGDVKRSTIKYGKNRTDTHMVKQVVCMLIAVIIVFALCWAPLLIDNTLTSYEVLETMRFGFRKYMLSFFHVMAYFNSCINPIIYGFMSKSFRDSFKSALCCATDFDHLNRHGSYSRAVSRTGSQTRNTSIR